jgi:hypothetical protein
VTVRPSRSTATPCPALTSRWWLTGGYGLRQLVFIALPFLGVGVAAALSTKSGGEAPLRPRSGRQSIFPDLPARDFGTFES